MFDKKIFKLTKNNTLDNVFSNGIFSSYQFSYEFLKNYWIFINHGLFSQGNYFLQFYCFQF